MPKIVKANGKTFTFGDDVSQADISKAIDEYFNVKKKEPSEPIVPKKQLASPAQPTQEPTSSDTEELQPQQESDGLAGPPKKLRLAGEKQSPLPEVSGVYDTAGNVPVSEKAIPIQQIKPTELVPSKSKIKNLEKELSSVKVTPKNQEEVSRKTDELSLLRDREKQIENERISNIEQTFKEAKNEDVAVQEANKRLDDLKTTTGLWNNIKAASIDVYNKAIEGAAAITDEAGIKELKVDVDPLSEYKKEVRSKSKLKLSDEELNAKAEQLYKDRQIENIETDNINSFLDNLDDSDRLILKQSRKNQAEHLNEDNLKHQKVINAYEVVGNKKIEEFKNLENQLLVYKNNNQPLPKELYDSYMSLGDEIRGISTDIQKRKSAIDKNKSDLGTVNQEFDFLKRQYGDIDNEISNIGLAGTKILNGVIGFTNYASKFGGGVQGELYSLAGQQVAQNINNYINDQEDYLRKDVKSIESAEGFVNYASDLVAKQIPNLLVASTGVGGLGVIGMSSTGEKFTSMNKDVLEGKASYSPIQMASAPLLYGGAEVISEIPTMSILKKGGRVFESIVKNEGELIAKSAKEKAKEWAKDFAIDMSKETAGEEFTNFAQNFTDKYVLGKKNVGLLDNTGTVFKDTFTLTSILKVAPHIAGAILKPLQKTSDLIELSDNSKKIIEFSKQLNNEALTDVEKSVIKKQIAKSTEENSKIIAKTISQVHNMPDEVYTKLIDLNNQAADVKNQAISIHDGNLPNKDYLIEELRNEYKDIQTERTDLIDGEYQERPVVERVVEEIKPVANLASEYIESIEKAKTEAPEKFWSVDRPFQKEDGTIDEVQLNKAAEDGRLIKTDAGFGVVGEDGDIKGVFKADLESTEKTGDKVIQEAIKKGGIKLDNFALPNLMKVYERNGFREVSRLPFNEEYAPEGWTKEQGTPDVVAMVYDPNGELNIEKKTFDDYDEAMKYRDTFLVKEKPSIEVKPTIKSKLEAFKTKYIAGVDTTNLDTQVENAKKSLVKVLPNIKFVVHNTRESFIKEAGKNARGYYNVSTGTIHINALDANSRTVAHEVFHSILLDKVKTDINARELTKKMINAVSKTLDKNPELKKTLEDFVKNYDENIKNEERLSELFGYLADGYEGFDAPTKSLVKKFLDRIATMFGLEPFTEGDVVDMLKTLSGKVSTGEEIVSKDIKAISEGASSYISEPIEIKRLQKISEEKVEVKDHKLSFVKKSDLIDINSLMKDITEKKQKVWFWVADQLGRGNYFDSKIDGEHYLDAGPSFALDPINRDKNVIWASGKNENEINKLIGRSDYIFIISGSPLKSKLFNKNIIDIVAKRAGDFNKFKEDVLSSSKIKSINEILSSIKSWDELKDSVKRKEFLLAIQDQKDKNTPLKNTLDKYNSIIDLNELRDGFYKDNKFELNDIMLVLKPTGFGGKSEHSTYENNILGDVVGVPDTKINAFDVMPEEIKNKYKEDLGKSQQQQAVAPYGIGVKEIERFQETGDYSDMKEIVKDMIDDGMSISDIKKIVTDELGPDSVSMAESAYNELTTEKKVVTRERQEVKPTKSIEEFRDKVKDVPQSGIVGKYLSGETIKRVEGETPRNAQDIDSMILKDAGDHGVETISMARDLFGDKYVEKTLEFLDASNLKAHEKAILYVSLENEMFNRVNDNPDSLGDKKLQDLVRSKSQQFLRESSLAINAGRLRAIMKDGYTPDFITNKFLSNEQLSAKADIEKAIQSNADAIQEQYEDSVAQIEKLILEGIEKRVNEIYTNLPTNRRLKADKAIAALESIQRKLKGKAYDATIGLPIALIDSGITIIKNSIKAGVNIADAIEIGINHIKEKFGKEWVNEDMFRSDMINGFKAEGITEKEQAAKDLVKQSLIEAGFGKEITVKTRDGRQKRNVLDWKKLAGEEGSIDKIRDNVENALKNKGFDIEDVKSELEEEYNNLRAGIIEKSLNDLESRNIPRKRVDLKTSAKKLAEIYNRGAFEKEADTYDHLMNTVLGMNQLDQESFNEAKVLAKKLSELFSKKNDDGSPISQESLKHGERVINKKIEELLSKVAWSESNGLYKAVIVAKEFVGLAQRNALVSVGQAIDNTMSGYVSRIFNKIGFAVDNVDTKSLANSRNELAKMTFKDITLNGGLEFGDVTSPFITKSKTQDLIVNASDSKLYHALASSILGKPFLESADSMHKSALTAKFFQYNLIKILRKKGYSKTEAKNYVSEQLTGQTFDDALVKSKQIIDEINKDSDKKVISDSKESVYRFANDLINESLIQGEKINIDEIKAAINAAESAAGFELGHEPNNIVSKPLNLFNSWLQTRIDRAVKEKKWNDAAALSAASIVSTNILNPFLGGGTNWAFLGMQKTGVPTLSTFYWNVKARGTKLDLNSEEGMKNLESTLKYQLLAKNANTRMFIGATLSLAAFALAKATGADDDFYKWLKKNKWSEKYFNKVSPPAAQFMIAQKDKKLSEFLGKQMNLKVDAFDEGAKIKRAIKDMASGKKQRALGGLGQLLGSRVSTPIIPWRVVKDVRDIYRGVNGLPPIKTDYKASGFGSGYFQGGMLEQLGLRPKNVADKSQSRFH